eukprot:4508955-Amphidinium_carterae.2
MPMKVALVQEHSRKTSPCGVSSLMGTVTKQHSLAEQHYEIGIHSGTTLGSGKHAQARTGTQEHWARAQCETNDKSLVDAASRSSHALSTTA